MLMGEIAATLFAASSVVLLVAGIRAIRQDRFSVRRLRLIVSVISLLGAIQVLTGVYNLANVADRHWRILSIETGFMFWLAAGAYWYAIHHRPRKEGQDD
jgi:hypothetical protein